MPFKITKLGSEPASSGFRVTKLPEEEGFAKRALRTAAAIPVRFAQGAVSAPGDMLNLAGMGQKALGGQSYEEMQQEAPISFPTSSQTGEFVDKMTGGALAPQGGWEELAQNVAQDVGGFIPWVLAGPIRGVSSTLSKVGKYLPSALLGNAAQQGTKELGGGPLLQAGARLAGGSMPNFLGNTKQLRKLKDTSYKSAEGISSKGHYEEVGDLQKNIHKMFHKISKADVPEKDFIQDRIRAIDRVITNKHARVQEMWDLKKSLNKYIHSGKHPDAQPYLKQLVGEINQNVMQKFGKRNFEFGKHFNVAEDIHRGFNDVSTITKFLNQHVNLASSLKNPVVKSLLLGGVGLGFGAPAAAATAVGGATGAVAAREIARFTDLIRKSSQARQLWQRSLKQALHNNTAGFAQTVSKLDDLAEKEGL